MGAAWVGPAQQVVARALPLVLVGVALSALTTVSQAAGPPDRAPTPDRGEVHTLASPSSGYAGPTSVVDPQGNTTVVWSTHWRRGKIRAVRRPAGGQWGTPVTIARRGTWPIAATDARGNVTVVFQTNRRDRTTGVSAVQRRVGSGWQHPIHLSKDRDAPGYRGIREGPYGAGGVDLAVSPRGDAVVVWQWGSYDRDRPFRIQAVYRPAGHGWGPLARLTKPNWSAGPVVAIGPQGMATMVYSAPDQEAYTVVSRRRVAGEGWKRPVPLRGGIPDAELLVDRSGTATFTFAEMRHDRAVVMASRRPVDAVAWSKPLRISPRGADIYAWSSVQHTSGAISVAMQRHSGRIDVVRRTPGGAWLAPVQVSLPGHQFQPPDVVTNASGVLFVLWPTERHGVRGRIRYPEQGWTRSFRVSPGAEYTSHYEAEVYPDGDTFVLWLFRDHVVKVRRMFR